MFSTVTSAFFSNSLTISSPFGDFRLIASDFLLTLNWWKYQGSSSGLPGRRRRPGSPRPGFSILTTSAPNQASTSVEVVPASNWVKSTTLTPCRKLRSWVLSLILFPPVCAQNPGTQPAPSRAGLQCSADSAGDLCFLALGTRFSAEGAKETQRTHGDPACFAPFALRFLRLLAFRRVGADEGFVDGGG